MAYPHRARGALYRLSPEMARVLPARGALPLIFLLKRAKAQPGEAVIVE